MPPDAAGARGLEDVARPLNQKPVVGDAPPGKLADDADKVDDRVAPSEGLHPRPGDGHVAGDDLDALECGKPCFRARAEEAASCADQLSR